MISITIKMDIHVPLDYDKYSEVIYKVSRMFHDALADNLKTTYRGEYAWITVGKDVVISFRTAEMYKKYGNMPSGIIITEHLYLTIITDDFKVLSKYVEKIVDVINNSPQFLFNVAIVNGDVNEQQ
jgi:hypothetical protein